MTRLLLGTLWIAVVVLVGFPIAYFILHWSDSCFRDGAVGNWFGTVVGVIVGVPVGMALAGAQQRMRSESDRLLEKSNREERQGSIEHRVYDEVQHDSTLVGHLAEVLSKSPTARSDLWSWAEQIVSGMEFDAYRELDAMLLPKERATYARVARAHGDLRRLVSRIRQSTAAHAFLYGYSANEAEANSRLSGAKAHVSTVQSELATALEDLRLSGCKSDP